MKFLSFVLIPLLISISTESVLGHSGRETHTGTVPAYATPTPTPTPQVDDQLAYEKAVAMIDPPARIKAIRKFLVDHPSSTWAAAASELLVLSDVEQGKALISKLDLAGAEEAFTAAIRDAPGTVSDAMFVETLLALPNLLMSIGQRERAFRLAKEIDKKFTGDIPKMLRLADFYMRVEDGTDAARIAAAVIGTEPSAAAYRTLGLASRIDFRLEESAAAYEKALELEPDSRVIKLSLADMWRALGRSSAALELYRQILEGHPGDPQANAGLVASLFETGKRSAAEAELARSIESGNNNVLMLAGSAYWYAANGEGKRAVELAQRAIAAEPRFIWSHIALARGYLIEGRPLDAERTLMSARQYGNFPTLDYEIASARIAAGLYREAGELLSRSFSLDATGISTRLGGRIMLVRDDFQSLLDLERQASILAPRSADTAENSEKVLQLFKLRSLLETGSVTDDELAAAADKFTSGSDGMRIHRLLFTAQALVAHKRIPEKVAEYAEIAVGKDEAGLNVASPSSAVLADELYESRQKAHARDEYIQIPDVPRRTLSAILRGRTEELNGAVLLSKGDAEQAAVRLRRAVSVLPGQTPWWRTSMWELGNALESTGKLSEALDTYVKCYKSDYPNDERYTVIEALYKRINEGTDGLEKLVGPDPRPAVAGNTVAKLEPPPTPKSTAEQSPSPTPTGPTRSTPTPTPEVDEPRSSDPISVVAPQDPTPTPTPVPASTTQTDPPATDNNVGSTPQGPPADNSTAKGAKPTLADLFPPVVISVADRRTPPKAADEPIAKPPVESETIVEKDTDELPVTAGQDLGGERSRVVVSDQDAANTPCAITLSDNNLLLEKNGGSLSVIVGTEDDRDLEGLKVVADDPDDINVRIEPISGIRGRALYVISSVSTKPGAYKVTFQLDCGKKELLVTVH